jgi:hypothetical protein
MYTAEGEVYITLETSILLLHSSLFVHQIMAYRMKKIYLDYNIVVRLTCGNEQPLNDLIASIDRSKFQIIYSPAHIEEIAVSTKRHNYPLEKTKEKLDFLSLLTNNIELLPFMRNDVRVIEDLGLYLCEEHPENCYERVVAKYENNDLAEQMEEEFLTDATKKNIYGNDPIIINNTAPEIVLLESVYDLSIKEAIFMTLLSTTKYNKDQIRELMGVGSKLTEFSFALIKTDFSVIETAMQIVFNELELIRYRPEKQKNYRSRLHDVSHSIYAAYCDYFITEDSKLSYKAKATYAYLKIDTVVMDINGLTSIVSN